METNTQRRTLQTTTMETPKPLVSVSIVTYNQEQYIKQTLDSVLAQVTNFPFEIVIGEDASTDQTRHICQMYADKHPDVIRVLDTPHNLGSVPNFMRTLKATRGKYIALLDGDDYWIDPQKLQKQVDLFEKDDKMSLCFTGRKNYDENSATFEDVHEDKNTSRFYLNDFAQKTYFHTSTVMLRKPKNDAWIDRLAGFKIGDRPVYLSVLFEQKGYAYKMKDVCSVFRINDNSLFTPTKPIERSIMVANMYAQLKEIYPHLSHYFNQHINISDYFILRDAYRKKDKTAVKKLRQQILQRPTTAEGWWLKVKTILHYIV
jgi:glycosyltransferase involved in cell wall biosynthesis